MSLNLAIILREGARRHAGKIALVFGETRISYGELEQRAALFAGALLGLGVGRGAHVALMMPNVPEFTIAYFGCQLAGVVAVPLNVMLKSEEVSYHLADSDAVALVAWHSLAEVAFTGARTAPACTHHIIAGGAAALATNALATNALAANALATSALATSALATSALATSALAASAVAFDALLEAAVAVTELPDTAADDTAVLLYTSGTTGRSKGAMLTHFNLFYNAEAAAAAHAIGPDTVSLAVLPLFHSFGQTVIQNGTLLRGGTVVALERFEVLAAVEAIERHSVTFFAGVPTMYFALLHHPDAARFKLASLRTCASGGAPMPVEVMQRFDTIHGTNILEGYGLSETSPVACVNPQGRPKKVGSIGMPLWGVEFRLVRDDGSVISETHVPGELCIKGHNVMKGYYKRPEATLEAMTGGWFRSGDIATKDEDGYYFIVDRKKDMVLRGGFNVYPREIEEVLYRHPAIAEAAVIGIPHESLGEDVLAVVSLKSGATATGDELIAFCKERLATYKYPRSVRFVTALPKGPTGKILKRELR
ncbi:MAG: long-chain fatty acid--CoA ligase [Myxococcales bacterium]|nr:long-chain fatty acid--CoA ligase [Myxococcales bacterium]